MKAKKTLVLLLALPVLGGCSKGVVEEPNFRAYSNEVTLEVFAEKYAEAYNASVFMTNYASVPYTPLGGEFKVTSAGENEFSFKGENKGSLKKVDQEEEFHKIDIVNKRYDSKENTLTTTEGEFKKSGESTKKEEDKAHRYVGMQTVGSESKCVVKDYISGEDAHVIGSGESAVINYINYLESTIKSYVPTVQSVEDMKKLPEQSKAEYKFYADGSVFTFVHEFEHKGIVESETGSIIGESKTELKYIRQVDFSATSFFVGGYQEEEVSIKFNRRGTYEYSNIVFDVEDGDKATTELKSALVVECSFNDAYVVNPVDVPQAA